MELKHIKEKYNLKNWELIVGVCGLYMPVRCIIGIIFGI